MRYHVPHFWTQLFFGQNFLNWLLIPCLLLYTFVWWTLWNNLLTEPFPKGGGVTVPSHRQLSAKLPVGKMRVCGKSYYVHREIARYRYVFVIGTFRLPDVVYSSTFLRLINKINLFFFFCLSLVAAQIFRESTFWQNL